jgi:glycosyltransferase involved in cell wall biosynthesis
MTRPLRLGFLTSHPIQYQAPLFRELASRPDVDLTVFFCCDRGAARYHDKGFQTSVKWDVPLLDGYRHVFLPNWRRSGTPDRFTGLFNPSIVRHLMRERFDGIVVHGWGHATNWVAFAAARATGTPLFIRGEANGLAEPSGARGVTKRIVLRTLFKRATGALAIGSLNSAFYQMYGVSQSRIHFAPYAVDNQRFRAAAVSLRGDRARIRRSHGIAEDATVFLFCGKLIPAKRPLDVVEAARLLPEGASNTYVVFAGDGPLRSDLEARIARVGLVNVTLAGFRNQNELPELYTAADALVLPSAFEPWGLVINEALNFGLYVIASDRVGAGPDLIADPQLGARYPAGDTSALAGAMTAFASRAAVDRTAVAAEVLSRWSLTSSADGIVRALRSYGVPQRVAA